MKTKLLNLALIFILSSCCEDVQPEAPDQNAGDFIDRSEYSVDEFQRGRNVSLKYPRFEAESMPSGVPIGIPVFMREINSKYQFRSKSVVMTDWLNSDLGGVLKGKGKYIVSSAKKYGICPVFLAAICMHESGNGTSNAARVKNNICGIMVKGKTLKTFDNVPDCIDYTAKLLSGGIYKKCKTVADIQKVYCPIGAKNDPTGLNKNWLSGVVGYMKRIAGDTLYAKL